MPSSSVVFAVDCFSRDGTGRWRDNVFVKRLWRSPKYEDVYLHAYETVVAAGEGVARYLTFCN